MNVFLPALVCALILTGSADGKPSSKVLSAWLGSSYLLPGEESELWLTITSNTRPLQKPRVPQTEALSFKFLGDTILPHSIDQRTYAYRYLVLSYQEGSHIIPPFYLDHEGAQLASPPLKLNVKPLSEAAWFSTEIEGESCSFASRISLPEKPPFEGEAVQAEAKIYIPARFQIEKASIAELAREGLAAERFDVSAVIPEGKMLISTVRLKQKEYTGLAYRSTITPLTGGHLSIGPGTIPLTLLVRVSRRGLTETVPTSLEVPLPRVSATARSLPRPKPEGFRNAIGRFTMTASAKHRGMRIQDPISVQLTIEGSGNLNTLSPPEVPGEMGAWKSYPPHRLPRRTTGNHSGGSVTFTQTLRPIGSQSSIPSFRFVSFNPETEKYVTSYSAPIPLEFRSPSMDSGKKPLVYPSSEAPLSTTDNILGIKPFDLFGAEANEGIHPAWHFIPGVLSIILLVRLLRVRILSRLASSPGNSHLLEALDTLERDDIDQQQFLRRAGSLIEQCIPEEARDNETREILAKRDQYCYRPDGAGRSITESRRQEIIQHVRQHVIKNIAIIALLASLFTPEVNASADPAQASPIYQQAEAAWDDQTFRLALDLYQEAQRMRPTSPDILYNLGNCHFQLGEPGLAALYYHRALQLNPSHPEALQNLRFVQAETGAVGATAPYYKKWISSVTRNIYATGLAFGLWSMVLSSLCLLQIRRFRKLFRAVFLSGALTGIGTGACLIHYPTPGGSGPRHRQAVIIDSIPVVAGSTATSLQGAGQSRAAAGQGLFPVAPGTLCHLIARRGEWTYIEITNGLRGWVPSSSTCAILPVTSRPEHLQD